MTRSASRRLFRDPLGRELAVRFPPRRVVSLCPSLTETLFALGAGRMVAGRTRYCRHPAQAVAKVPTVGGTRDVDLDAVRRLEPDLVIAAREENRPEVVKALESIVPVYVTDVTDCDSALDTILALGALTDRDAAAGRLVESIRLRFERLRPVRSRPVAYLVWWEPIRAVGRNTYIGDLLRRCGFVNVVEARPGRYPELTMEALRELRPELILLSSEPYPFTKDHADRLTADLPGTEVRRVDGEMFGWYGARMLPSTDYLNDLLVDLG